MVPVSEIGGIDNGDTLTYAIQRMSKGLRENECGIPISEFQKVEQADQELFRPRQVEKSCKERNSLERQHVQRQSNGREHGLIAEYWQVVQERWSNKCQSINGEVREGDNSLILKQLLCQTEDFALYSDILHYILYSRSSRIWRQRDMLG